MDVSAPGFLEYLHVSRSPGLLLAIEGLVLPFLSVRALGGHGWSVAQIRCQCHGVSGSSWLAPFPEPLLFPVSLGGSQEGLQYHSQPPLCCFEETLRGTMCFCGDSHLVSFAYLLNDVSTYIWRACVPSWYILEHFSNRQWVDCFFLCSASHRLYKLLLVCTAHLPLLGLLNSQKLDFDHLLGGWH